MKRLHGMYAAGFLALGLLASTASAQQAQPGQPAQPGQQGQPAQKPVLDVPGPIDSLQDLQDTGKMLFQLADINDDNQISQKEAVDAGNLIVGGFFFRADTNGDGTLTQEEFRAARDNFLNQKPWLKYVVQTAKTEAERNKGNRQNNIADTVVGTFDTNNDKKLEAAEVRQGVQTIVQGVFATADTNRDGQLNPTEVNAALIGAGRSMAQAAFKQADKDGNGSISEQEFDDSMKQPVHMIFAVADLNHDGQLSQEEAQRLRQVIMTKLQQARFPEPPNSLRNLARTGQRPSEVAPVPNVNVPAAGTNQPPKPR